MERFEFKWNNGTLMAAMGTSKSACTFNPITHEQNAGIWTGLGREMIVREQNDRLIALDRDCFYTTGTLIIFDPNIFTYRLWYFVFFFMK